MELKWLTRQMLLAIHDEAVVVFGGLPGVRDMALLDSAMDRPKNLLAYGDNSSLFDLAAAWCFGIVQNHPFLDGNKRTGLLSARALLLLNGQVFEPAEVDEVTMMVGVAEGTVDEAMLASWLARFSTRSLGARRAATSLPYGHGPPHGWGVAGVGGPALSVARPGS